MKTTLIIDTETANSIAHPLPYDLGYRIVDNDTEEVYVERSFVAYEIYTNKDMMNSAYYAKKLPQYEIDLKAGKRKLCKMETIKRIVAEDMKKYNCTTVGAYNMPFDKRSTLNGIRHCSEQYKYFFPYGTEFIDIWSAACSSILRSKWFIKFAIENGYVSPKGNILTSAEVAYRYITKNTEFVEEHTGLEDVKIETEIFFKLLKTRMKVDWIPFGAPWRMVQKYRKEFAL